MTFSSPELLLALLLVPAALVVYLLIQRRRTRYVVRFTNVALLENLAPRTPSWRRHVPTALYLVAIAALGVALARPSMTLAVPREEATVMLAMDTSRSMLATDVEPGPPRIGQGRGNVVHRRPARRRSAWASSRSRRRHAWSWLRPPTGPS